LDDLADANSDGGVFRFARARYAALTPFCGPCGRGAAT